MKFNAHNEQMNPRTNANWPGAATLLAQSQPQESEKPLVLEQANEIAALHDALADAKDAARLKEKLLNLKKRWNDPAWHEHLCGR